MGEPNWQNRTLFHGDNLPFLRAMNSESVDLIATDPRSTRAATSTPRLTVLRTERASKTGGRGKETFTTIG